MNLARQIVSEIRQRGSTTLVHTCEHGFKTRFEITFANGAFQIGCVTLAFGGRVPVAGGGGATEWRAVLGAIKGYARDRRKQN